MEKLTELLKFITKDQKGIEIGPYFNPLVPKSAGWDVLVLDVFDIEDLRIRAKADPNLADDLMLAIEPVDLVGPAHRVAELAEAKGVAPGSIDFILSSHNFEHLPDPVRFLQAATRLLRPGGVLSMAIPDCRTCFDALRPPSTAGGMIAAFFEARERPSAQQEYESHGLYASCRCVDGRVLPHFIDTEEGAAPVFANALPRVMERWQARRDGGATDYGDSHCWTLTPATFGAILAELRLLGLVELDVEEISPNNGIEFYAHLRRPVVFTPPDESERAAAYTAQLREFQTGAPRLRPPPLPPAPVPMGRKAMIKALILGTPLLGPAARAVRRLVRPR